MLSKVYLSNFYNINVKKNQQKNYLAPLKCDTVSFGALKKTQFSGIDLLIVNKFKPPIEKFNNNEDLQKWCKEKINNITKKDYKGRQNETKIQRKEMLSEWFKYVQNENDAYNGAISLLILDGITKDLEPDSDKLPPVLNKGILAQTIDDIQNKIKENPKFDVNFSKLYQLNLQKLILSYEKDNIDESKTGWIIIPSYEHDPKNFDANVEKLKLLSHINWCTKSYNAEPYLKQGDFHVYLDKGRTKLGIRFVGDVIREIQGEKNNTKIPVKYFDIVKEHVKNKKLGRVAKDEVEEGQETKYKVDEIKNKLGVTKNSTAEDIFKAFGIDVKKDKDGFLIISEFHQPRGKYNNFTFEDFDIDENKLIKNVKIIEGYIDFENSQITQLGNLQTIKGDAYFINSKITTLGKLQNIEGHADFKNSQIIDLGNLQYIGGSIDFSTLKITSLGNLHTIGGDAFFAGSNITNLGNLQKIGGTCYIFSTQKDLIEQLKERGFGDKMEIYDTQKELNKRLLEKLKKQCEK